MSGALVIPARGSPVTAESLMAIEKRLAAEIGNITDFGRLEEWRAQARALEHYLRDKELQGPMLGSQRRIEGRIGQLGDVAYRGKHGINDKLISEFRILARCLSGDCQLEENDWSTRELKTALSQSARVEIANNTPDTFSRQNGKAMIVLNDRWRVRLDDPLQWILERRQGRPRKGHTGYRGSSYCTQRSTLLRDIHEKIIAEGGEVDSAALRRVASLPEKFPYRRTDEPHMRLAAE